MPEPLLYPVAGSPSIVAESTGLTALLRRCSGADIIAVDLEANGFHAYAPKLCAVQLALHEEGHTVIAIVDPLAFDATPLTQLFDATGPIKVLHDLSYDARLLKDAGIALGNVHDTAVCARFLGENATGLASLLKARFDIELGKALQRHDWASRPFTDKHIGYLAGDVAYLLDLNHLLRQAATAKGIVEEVDIETEHRLRAAAASNGPAKPPHSRIKGYGKLSLVQQGVLREIVLTRDHLAQEADVPLGDISPNALLLEFARRQPAGARAVRGICGRKRSAARHANAWSAAVDRGVAAGPPPKEELDLAAPKTIPREERKARKVLESRVQAWRQEAAKKREVDRQVILPGHCLGPTVSALYDCGGELSELRRALEQVSGFGACRIARYDESLLALTQPPPTPPETAT